MATIQTDNSFATAKPPSTAPPDPLVDTLVDDLAEDGDATHIGGGTTKNPPDWSARVVASTGGAHLATERNRPDEWASGDFTDAFTDLLDENPDLSFDDVLDMATDMNLGTDMAPQMPTEFSMGKGRTDQASNKYSLILANGDYDQVEAKKHGFTDIKDLKAKGDAISMAGSLASRGFNITTFGVHMDQKGSQLIRLIAQAVQDPRLSSGDVLVVHYSGHGLRQSGMVGVDGVEVTNSFLGSLPTIAQARGIQLRLILDACHSGNTAASARNTHNSVEKSAARSAGDTDRKALYDELMHLRQFTRRLRRNCLTATREWAEDEGGALMGPHGRRMAHEATKVKFGPKGDVNIGNVIELMRSHPEGVSRWWEEEGWQELYFLLDPFDQAYPDLGFNPPNADHEVSFASLQDALDDLMNKISVRMGIESTEVVKKAFAGT